MTKYPLQNGPNCVAYSYWVAMNEALLKEDPYRKLDFSPEKVVSLLGGGPALPDGLYLEIMRKNFPTFLFFDIPPPFDKIQHATVVACWDQGYPHAVCLLPSTSKTGFGYDPAQGNTDREIDYTKCARAVLVRSSLASEHPYAKWYWRFTWLRWL